MRQYSGLMRGGAGHDDGIRQFEGFALANLNNQRDQRRIAYQLIHHGNALQQFVKKLPVDLAQSVKA